MGSGRACRKRKVSLGKRKRKKERKVKSWAAEEQKGKKSKLLGSGRACRKRKVSLGDRKSKKEKNYKLQQQRPRRKRKVSLGKQKSKKERKVKCWAAEEHVGKENSVLGSGRAKKG